MTENETPEPRKHRSFPKFWRKLSWISLLVGTVLGVVLLAAVHFIRDRQDHTHYHANFALYLNGQKDEFKSPTYYEEIQTCGEDLNNPRARVHLHDEQPSIVHVHDQAVTWGALFANLGYTLGDNLIKTPQGLYVDGQDGKKLTFILNGQSEFNIANRVIGDKDVLLINYGDQSQSAMQKEFAAIPRTAAAQDASSDPATCSGSAHDSIGTRLKKALAL